VAVGSSDFVRPSCLLRERGGAFCGWVFNPATDGRANKYWIASETWSGATRYDSFAEVDLRSGVWRFEARTGPGSLGRFLAAEKPACFWQLLCERREGACKRNHELPHFLLRGEEE